MRPYPLLLTVTLLAAPVRVAPAQGNPASATGVKKDIIAQLNDAESKLVQLAKAFPDAKFGWSPPGARTVSEVFIHVAAENIDIPPMTGVPASATKMPANAEKTVTTKAAVLDLLTKSFAYAKASVMALPDAQMDASASYLGTPMSKRGIMMAVASHGNEHLGQLIAYARVNSIVPPWSQ